VPSRAEFAKSFKRFTTKIPKPGRNFEDGKSMLIPTRRQLSISWDINVPGSSNSSTKNNLQKSAPKNVQKTLSRNKHKNKLKKIQIM